MINKIKKTSLIIIVLGLVLILFGVTYSFFNYTEFSNELITNNGLVYMKLDDYNSNNITLNNVFPENIFHAQQGDNFISFEVYGKNTYQNPIYYEIDLEYGEDILGKTRINDRYLKFALIEFIEEENGEFWSSRPILQNVSFDSIQDRRIYIKSVSTEESEFVHYYALYMWYDENIIISDTDPQADFRASDLNNDKGNGDLPIYSDLYASVKVKVYGDFEPKKLYDETPASCFVYRRSSEPMAESSKNEKIIPKFLSEDEYIIIYDYDESCGTNLVFPEYIDNLPVRKIYMDHYLFSDYDVKSIYISKYINEINHRLSIGSDGGVNPLIERIEVDPENTTFDSREGCNALIETQTNSLLVGCKNTVIIPSTITEINSYAFYKSKIRTIVILPNVTNISVWSFDDCSELKDIYVAWENLNNSLFFNFFSSIEHREKINLHIPNGTRDIYSSYGFNIIEDY